MALETKKTLTADIIVWESWLNNILRFIINNLDLLRY